MQIASNVPLHAHSKLFLFPAWEIKDHLRQRFQPYTLESIVISDDCHILPVYQSLVILRVLRIHHIKL